MEEEKNEENGEVAEQSSVPKSALSRSRDAIPARLVLGVLILFATLTSYFTRVNISLAVIVMVGARNATNSNATQEYSECLDSNFTGNGNYSDTESQEMDQRPGEFDWNEITQGFVLGAFYWGYLVSQIPGGRLTEVWGTKRVLGHCLLWNALLSVVSPVAARGHWGALFAVRVLQGLLQGVLFPSISTIYAKWIPVEERAKFMAATGLGGTLGTIINLPLCGLIIHTWGWEAAFYAGGAFGVLWCLAWWLLVFESPEEHPRISSKEKELIKRSIGDTASTKPPKLPWVSIVTSLQAWAGIIACIGSDWGFYTIFTYGPKYMHSVLGFNMKQNSLLSGLPFLARYCFATSYGCVVDWLLKQGKFKLVTLRKMSIFISHILTSLGIVIYTFSGCDVIFSIAVLTISFGFNGALTSGHFLNAMDIAPNFSGTLTGLGNGLGAMTGIISPSVAGFILENDPSVSGWRILFYTTAVLYASSSLVYLIFATAAVQPWNFVKDKKETKRMLPQEKKDEQAI